MSVTRSLISRFTISKPFHKPKGLAGLKKKRVYLSLSRCILCYELPLSSQWVCLGEPKSPFYPLTLLPLLPPSSSLTLRLSGQALQISHRPRSSSFFKTDDRRSLFRCEIQSSPIEINPRATELHTSPTLSWPKEE